MQTPLALVASLLAVLVWLLSRRRPNAAPGLAAAQVSSRQPDASALVVASAADDRSAAVSATAARGAFTFLPPLAPGVRQQRLQQLRQSMAGDPEQRLGVMETLAAVPDRAALPLLKRGLRDADPRVMAAAARSVAAYRGRTAGASGAALTPRRRLPRNAAPRG